jgi:hypothetical protein
VAGEPRARGGERRIGVLLTTHNRVDDARGAMEVIRSCWVAPGAFGQVELVHAYNGELDWYPDQYLEDRLRRVPNEPTHFRGAASLLDVGLEDLSRTGVRYVVGMTADVWAYKPAWVAQLVDEMERDGLRLACGRWHIDPEVHGLVRAGGAGLLPTDGLSTDFFVIDLPWAVRWKMIPLDYSGFLARYGDLLDYLQDLPFLERFVAGRFLSAVRAEMTDGGPDKDPWGSEGPRRALRLLRLVPEREIDPSGRTAPSHKGHWPRIGLVTSEDPACKREIALANPRLAGATLDRLRAGTELSWYNRLDPGM